MSLFTQRNTFIGLLAFTLTACNNVSEVQKKSPNHAFKDYEKETIAVIGVGDPISKRQMKANATMKIDGNYPLEAVIRQVAGTFNVAIRWDNGVRKNTRRKVLVSELTFDEVRSYIEDVYEVQIVREGERRLLILPSADEPRIKEFAPGINVRLSQAVRGLAKECGMNLVISENKSILADTLVTTSLRDVTCRDAMSSLLVPHGLSLIDAGDYFTIGGYPTREWVLDLYEMERSENKSISYQSEFSGNGEGSTSSGGSVEIDVTSERNIWEELEENLSALVEKSCDESESQSANTSDFLAPPGAGGGFVTEGGEETETASSGGGGDGSFVCGYVRVNKSVGMVQMRAPVPVLEQADEIIQRVQDIASRRLLVEARVIAVTKTRGFQQGARFASEAHDDNTLLNFGSSANLDETLGFGSLSGNITTNIAPRLVNLVSSTGAGFLAAQSNSLDLVAKLAEQYGTTYQLMSPTLEIMDRQRAIMVDGRNEKYFVLETNVETTDAGSVTTTTAEERTQFVGLQFSVAAQVSEGDKPHTVSIQVPMLEISRFVTVPDGSSSQVPVVTSRIIDQKVRIRDGEIKVIGGLNRTIAVDRESGVPLLRGIPVAGKLFNEEDITYEDVEFIVLLQVRRIY